jgi:hypothetical protein
MTAINAVTDYALDGDVGVITLNSPPVNALSFNVRDGLAGLHLSEILRQEPQITRSLRRLRRVSAEPGADNS